MNQPPIIIITVIISLLLSMPVYGDEWTPVTDEASLKKLFSDTQHTAILKGDVKAKSTYNSDGTGELKAWGDTFKRQWKAEDGKVTLMIDGLWRYYAIERNAAKENEYRATRKDTGEQVVFQVEGANVVTGKVSSTDSGDTAKPSADEIAKSLANPNTPLATLTAKLQFQTFEGDLPDADNQSSTTLVLQPSFPFPTKGGNVVYFRPAFPFILDRPVFSFEEGGFDGESGFGDQLLRRETRCVRAAMDGRARCCACG